MTDQHKQHSRFYKVNKDSMTWYLFDASGKTLGRLASEISKVLRGKHKPTFTPNMAMGDGVIVINAKEVVVTGRKEAQKVYYTHSGHLGGLKKTPYRMMQERHPDRIITLAVRGMMPKNKLSKGMLKQLRVFGGAEHDMQAQKPIPAAI